MLILEKKPAKPYNVNLRKNAQGKFANTGRDATVQYLIGDLTDQAASQGYGIQTRRIVTCFFIGTITGDAMVKDVEAAVAGQQADSPFNGELPKPVFGAFYDIPLGGRYKTSFTPAGATAPITTEVTTISQFIADGDDHVKVALRATKQFVNDPGNESIPEANQGQSDQASEAAVIAAANSVV